MDKFSEYREILKMRYSSLYGNRDCEIWVTRECNKLLISFLICILVITIVICNDISAGRKEYSNVKVNKNGEIIEVTRPPKGNGSYSFTTKVKVFTDEGEIEKEYYITIEPAGEVGENEISSLPALSENDSAEEELKRLISGLNENTEDTEIILPQELENGNKIVWMKADNTDPAVYVIGALIVIWFIYHNRFHTIIREEKLAKESIIKELPEFINKIVLLINAGVILNTAFLKIVDDCDETKRKNSYFYRRICDIGYMVKETNASFYQEMYMFAKHSGVKELMRITNIMLDNMNKGDDLSDKLKRENELLWFARKQQAEEKGKLAETKLTLPLMILLTVLIMVTIAPALMEI